LSIYDRAINLLVALEEHIPAGSQVIFMCHSYGGLLVKQMIRTGFEIEEFNRIQTATCGVVFFGTPHTGSDVATFISRFALLHRSTRAISELRSDEPSLIDLNNWFRRRFRDLNMKAAVFVEALATHGFMVVSASSSDPALPDTIPIHVDANHTDLPKVYDEGDLRVQYVGRFISRALAAKRNHLKETAAGNSDLRNALHMILQTFQRGDPLDPANLHVIQQERGNSSSHNQITSANPIATDLVEICQQYSKIEAGFGQALVRRSFVASSGAISAVEAAITQTRH